MSDRDIAEKIDSKGADPTIGQAIIVLARNIPNMKAVIIAVFAILSSIGGMGFAVMKQIGDIRAYPARLSTAETDIKQIKEEATGVTDRVEKQRQALEGHLDKDALRWSTINGQFHDISERVERLDGKIDRVLTLLAEKR